MAFADVKGQEGTARFLRNAMESGRLAHAYIFQGFEGTGRALLARNFAKALNCGTKGLDACDRCVSCAKIDAGNHPDILRAEKDEKSGSIKIDEVRNLAERLSLRPFEGRWKVAIIKEAHMMTEEAANSFLKTLEEPPGHSIIILMTLSRHRLFPTIVSRCQTLTVPPLGRERLAAVLEEGHGMSGRDAALLARLSEGRLGRALALREAASANGQAVPGELRRKVSFDEMSRLGRDELCGRLSVMAACYRDMLVSKATDDKGLLINMDEGNRSEGGLARCGVEDLHMALDSILETISLIRRSVAVKLALGALFQEMDRCTRLSRSA